MGEEKKEEKAKNEMVDNGFWNLEKAREQFKREAALLDDYNNVIPLYRAKMIFGDWAEDFMNHELQLGRDFNGWGRPPFGTISYLTESGYLKLVRERNLRLMEEEMMELMELPECE